MVRNHWIYILVLCFSLACNLSDNGIQGSAGTPSESNPDSGDGSPEPDPPFVPTFQHGGWTDVVALGPKQDATGLYIKTDGTTSADINESDKSTRIGFAAFTGDVDVEGYEVFRATEPGGYDLDNPLFTLPTTATFFIDQSITPATAYWYRVHPMYDGESYATNELYSEIFVPAPPDNMALVHRWIANKETCESLPLANSVTIDNTNHFRCNYTGQGNRNGYFDIGRSYFMDRFEMGCDTNAGALYSNSFGQSCEIGGTFPNAASASQLATMASSAAHLPPLVYIVQSQLQVACNEEKETLNFSYMSRTLPKTLPRMVEVKIATTWPSNLSDTEINDLETGGSVANTEFCNTNNAHAGSESGSADRVGIDGSKFRTGSNDATAQCISRYGIQDLIGNTDEMPVEICDWSGGGVCQVPTSPIDPGATRYYNWTAPSFFGDYVGNITYFNPILGIPLNANDDGAWDVTATPNLFYDDLYGNPSLGSDGRFLSGGGSGWGNNHGRWFSYLSEQPGDSDGFVGGRCALPVPDPYNLECPSGYVPVIPKDGYSFREFCVAKYEMKIQGDDNGNQAYSAAFVAESRASGTPWVNLHRDHAINECQALGVGYDLITNDEWQTIAQNVELIGENWSSDAVGSGSINRGVYNNVVAGPLAASTDNDPCSGVPASCDQSVWHDNRRTNLIDGGHYIWDLGGNVAEWMKNDSGLTYSISANDWMTQVIDGGTFTNSPKTTFGPEGNYAGLGAPDYGGLGQGFMNSSGGATIRSSFWSAASSGIFATELTVAPNIVMNIVGFRCVYHP